MKTYYVVWFYCANYSLYAVEARNAAEARAYATGFYGNEFHEKATVMVWDTPPAFFIDPANNVSAAAKRALSFTPKEI